MKPAAYEYVRPARLADALSALAESEGEAKLIAGGQSLGPMLNLRIARPRLIIDIAQIPELRGIEDHGDAWRVGAAVTHAEIEDGALADGRPDCPLAGVARRIAYRAVRNRGTIGGSLAHADPAADWPLALTAIGARIAIAGPKGHRQVDCADLMITTFTTVMAPDEMIVSVDIPKMSPAGRWGYAKVCRKVGEFPSASAAVYADGERTPPRMYLGAMGGAPRSIVREGETWDSLDASVDFLTGRVGEVAPELDDPDRQVFTHCLLRALRQARRHD